MADHDLCLHGSAPGRPRPDARVRRRPAAGLATTQYSLLSLIARAPDQLTLGGLAGAQVMDRTTLTRALAPLVRDGLVKMVTGDDRRTRIISLTPHGQSTLDAARPIWRSAQEQVARDTGPDRIEHLLGELATLVEQVRQTSEGPSR